MLQLKAGHIREARKAEDGRNLDGQAQRLAPGPFTSTAATSRTVAASWRNVSASGEVPTPAEPERPKGARVAQRPDRQRGVTGARPPRPTGAAASRPRRRPPSAPASIGWWHGSRARACARSRRRPAPDRAGSGRRRAAGGRAPRRSFSSAGPAGRASGCARGVASTKGSRAIGWRARSPRSASSASSAPSSAPSLHRLDQRPGLVFGPADDHPRQRPAERGDDPRQEIGRDGRDHPEPKSGGAGIAQTAGSVGQIVGLHQQAPGAGDHLFAGVRGEHAPAGRARTGARPAPPRAGPAGRSARAATRRRARPPCGSSARRPRRSRTGAGGW